jgi:hypothetical protein
MAAFDKRALHALAKANQNVGGMGVALCVERA